MVKKIYNNNLVTQGKKVINKKIIDTKKWIIKSLKFIKMLQIILEVQC